jgi:hypothetical protein
MLVYAQIGEGVRSAQSPVFGLLRRQPRLSGTSRISSG